MKVLPAKITRDDKGVEQRSFPDDAPASFVAVHFDGDNYTFYEDGDDLPAVAR